ncbi:hypothetical protein POM88_035708 [Heracleum sosnowskyi]|uniref:Uncharacterized protein n=1 Tax=Heracleum sosnowskyi TaxID=360622 RepID=A0AAD8MDJ1_9APIA|nr:hypothetical protein POM88_035708 [Heracleum sosnowskyi]
MCVDLLFYGSSIKRLYGTRDRDNPDLRPRVWGCYSPAITMIVPLKHEPLRILCSTAIVSTYLSSITFCVGDTHYTLNRDILCDALHFPRDNFVNLPSEADLIQFFTNIHYQGQVDLVKLSKSNLVGEWDLLFDTLAKVFSNCTKTNFHNIHSLLQNIGFAVANNLRINFGHLIWNHLARRVLVARSDHSNGRKVKCFYPHFLTLMINHVLTDEHKQLFSLSMSENCRTTHVKFFPRLNTTFKYLRVHVVITPFMTQFIQLPAFGLPVPEQQPSVDQSTHAGTEDATPIQVVFPNPGSSSHVTTETQEVHRADHEFVEPQTLSQVVESNTELTPTTTEPELNVYSGEDSMREPTALFPPLIKRRTYMETTVSPSASSQRDMDFDMANEQYLETLSQQGESIEQSHRAMAIYPESSTLPLLTMGEYIPIDDTQDTLLGEHIGFDKVPTIVTVEVPSQAFEGKSDSLPSQIESFSPLPEGTSLAPLRDFPLADLSRECGRQPSEFNTEAIQFQSSDHFLNFTRDWDLRTPIAPPLTSQEEARVIFYAGTSSDNLERQLVVRTESQTPSDTQAREVSETPLRAIEVSAHTDTNTALLLAQIASLQKQLMETQAEKDLLKAQVVEQSSSSTSITNQLGTIKDDLEGLKGNLLPKMNAIQQSQVLVASDISDLTTSNAQISESVKEIATISAKVDFILQIADEHQTFNEEKMSRIEGGMEHLNEGMNHLYNMIKNSHQPNAEQKKFFEGDDDEDEDDEGGDGGNGYDQGAIRGRSEVNPDATQVKSVEDSSTKGENVEKQGGDQAGSHGAGGSGKDKGKQKLTFSDADYYQGEQGDFDFDFVDQPIQTERKQHIIPILLPLKELTAELLI